MPARKNKPHFTREALGAAKKKKAAAKPKRVNPPPEDQNGLEHQKQLKAQVTAWLMCPWCGWQEEITVADPAMLSTFALVCPCCESPVRPIDCL
jgi:hypothetical protein